jgi:hypothetical protein
MFVHQEACITLQAEMLPQPQTRPPLALSVASAAPPRSLLCIDDHGTRDSEHEH